MERFAKAVTGEPRPTVIASAHLSNEALYLVKKVLADHLGLDVVVPIHVGEERKIKNGVNEWVVRHDAHPNALGARLIGLRTVDAAELEQTVADRSGPLVVLDATAHPWLASKAAAEHAGSQELVVLGQRATPLTEHASVLLPLAAWSEAEGTYTSSTGRVQLARQAYAPSSLARPAARILADLAEAVNAEVTESRPRALFELAAAEVPAFAGMSYRRLMTEPGIAVREEVGDVD
jgi:NADH dehydrogenase/NADH:ubiquinone oxidoreductase subunit G